MNVEQKSGGEFRQIGLERYSDPETAKKLSELYQYMYGQIMTRTQGQGELLIGVVSCGERKNVPFALNIIPETPMSRAAGVFFHSNLDVDPFALQRYVSFLDNEYSMGSNSYYAKLYYDEKRRLGIGSNAYFRSLRKTDDLQLGGWELFDQVSVNNIGAVVSPLDPLPQHTTVHLFP